MNTAKYFRIFMLPLVLSSLLQAAYQPVQVSAATALTYQGQAKNIACDVKKRPSCPDFTSYGVTNASWKSPSLGYLGIAEISEVHLAELDRNIDVCWFEPKYQQNDPDRVQKQAVALVSHLQATHQLRTSLVVAKAFWNFGTSIYISGYIYVKSNTGDWRRNRDAALVDKIIMAHV